MRQSYQKIPKSTAGQSYDLLGDQTIRLYRYMKCSDIDTYQPLYRVTRDQFAELTKNKITNPFLALMVHYHVQDQKGSEDFGNVFDIGFDFPYNLQSIKKSPFISVTLHPWMAITGKSLDSLIISNDCLVELNVPLRYVMPTTDNISLKEGELLLLLPQGVDFRDLIVSVTKNGIYGQIGQPNVARQYLKDTYNITGGLVQYDGQYFRWNWTNMQLGGSQNPWNQFLKDQKGSGYSVKELRSIYLTQLNTRF